MLLEGKNALIYGGGGAIGGAVASRPRARGSWVSRGPQAGAAGKR